MNKTVPSINSLFEDVIESLQAREQCTNKKQITFIYHNQTPVSILISKDDLKVRLQSPDFSSIWFIINEVTKRLLDLYGHNAGGN